MYNYEAVDYLQSLVKAEWNAVRACHDMLLPDIHSKVLPQEFCGVVFYDNYAFAGSGHFLVRVKLQETFKGDPFFFDFNLDDVVEGYNPFGKDFDNIVNMFGEWKTYNLKIRPQDVIDLSDRHIQILRERRPFSFTSTLNEGFLDVSLKSKKGIIHTDTMQLWSPPETFPTTSVSLTYMYKLMELMGQWYHVVEMCANHDYDNVMVKAKNPKYEYKPDIRAILGKHAV